MSNKSFLRLESLEERLAPSVTSFDLDSPAPLVRLRRVVQDSVVISPTPDVRLRRVVYDSAISRPDTNHPGDVQLDAEFKTPFFQRMGGGTSPVTLLSLNFTKVEF